MSIRVVVLGAGFGGLELSSILSDELGHDLDLTLIDKSDSFVFGYSKLDVMFGRKATGEVRIPYGNIRKPGVTFVQEAITGIDPRMRRVTTDSRSYDADVLIVALGAEYDPAATPGLVEGGNEFYSVGGAKRLCKIIPEFSKGNAIVGVTSTPFKCPPAPSEAALLLHDFLLRRGVRGQCAITLVMPYGTPVPPSPETSKALLSSFTEKGITYIADHIVHSLDPVRKVVHLAHVKHGTTMELPYGLFLGIPRHRVPDVVEISGMAENGWVPVEKRTLKTKFPGVYAVGDVTSVGTPKAGVFAEGASRAVARQIIAEVRGESPAELFDGAGSCYVEFGGERVGRVDVDFFSGPKPTGSFVEPSETLVQEKVNFGASRKARWFGL